MDFVKSNIELIEVDKENQGLQYHSAFRRSVKHLYGGQKDSGIPDKFWEMRLQNPGYKESMLLDIGR